MLKTVVLDLGFDVGALEKSLIVVALFLQSIASRFSRGSVAVQGFDSSVLANFGLVRLA